MDPPTPAGVAHDMAGVPVFVGLPVAAAVSAAQAIQRRQLGWAAYSALSAAVTLIAVVRSNGGFAHQRTDWVDSAGAWQRVAIVAGLGWASSHCLQTLLRQSPGHTPGAGWSVLADSPGGTRGKVTYRM